MRNFLYLQIPRPSRPTLFPYTTLFRSAEAVLDERLLARAVALVHAAELGHGLVRLVHEDGEVRREERSEEHTSELQSRGHLVCRLLLEKKKPQGRQHPCRITNSAKFRF